VSARNDGGPAFPSHGSMGEVAQEGMTLRDYFAAAALQGSLSTIEEYSHELKRAGSKTPLEVFMARLAYTYADAMLKARSAS
jgi:hypothetical protein